MLSIRLFGKMSLVNSAGLEALHFGKLAELFSFLLLQRGRAHSREVLASLLWGETMTAVSKKHLRQALWQLQTILRDGTEQPMLVVGRDSVHLDVPEGVWFDVAAFESACAESRDLSYRELNESQARSLRSAVDLYRGDLLEGWYQEWCLIERERLQNLCLMALEKLMRYFQEQRQYDCGLEMGERILRMDRAHERTYQAMMMMQYQAGDRAGALRQYQRCETALRQELSVGPTKRTLELLELIRADNPGTSQTSATGQQGGSGDNTQSIVCRLRRILGLLSDVQLRVEKELQAIDQELPEQSASPAVSQKASGM